MVSWSNHTLFPIPPAAVTEQGEQLAGHSFLFAGQFSFFEPVQGRGNLFAVWVPFFLVAKIKTIQTAKEIVLAHGPDVEAEGGQWSVSEGRETDRGR